MRVLGVDPGSLVCGYAVISVEAPGRLRYVECGVLTAPRSSPAESRLGEIARCLLELVHELRPDLIALEDVFVRENPRSALALAQARGTILAVAGMSALRVYSYPPATVKKSVTGRGRASKEQVSRMVQALVGLRRAPPVDATDALAVAITHAHHMGRKAEAAA
jgi:crossover junction endodeoxyribonuclease RuvC